MTLKVQVGNAAASSSRNTLSFLEKATESLLKLTASPRFPFLHQSLAQLQPINRVARAGRSFMHFPNPEFRTTTSADVTASIIVRIDHHANDKQRASAQNGIG